MSGVDMEHPSVMVKGSGWLAVLLSVYPRHLYSMGLGIIATLDTNYN